MGNIITPRKILKKGKEVWASNKDAKRNTQPTKLERTGQSSFVITHEDGSQFEGKVDPRKVRFAEDSRKTASRFHIPDNIKIRNVMSNADRKRLGLELDPDLEK